MIKMIRETVEEYGWGEVIGRVSAAVSLPIWWCLLYALGCN